MRNAWRIAVLKVRAARLHLEALYREGIAERARRKAAEAMANYKAVQRMIDRLEKGEEEGNGR